MVFMKFLPTLFELILFVPIQIRMKVETERSELVFMFAKYFTGYLKSVMETPQKINITLFILFIVVTIF